MKRFLVVLTAMVVVGCSGGFPEVGGGSGGPGVAARVNTPPDPNAVEREARSGSRLKVLVLRSADGMVLPVADSMFDVQTNTSCVPALAVDGINRCVPLNAPMFTDLWADGNCSQRVVKVPMGQTVPYALVVENDQTGAAFVRVYAPGDVATSVFRSSNTAGCQPYDMQGTAEARELVNDVTGTFAELAVAYED